MAILFRYFAKLGKIVTISLLCLTVHAQDEISINGFWTNDINPENSSRVIYTDAAEKGPLYLCTKIKGNRDVLEVLRDGGTLPILSTRHKWFRYLADRPFFDETQKPFNVLEVAGDKEKKLAEFNSGVQQSGFFELYICSGKQNIRSGWWQVEVVYEDNTPVLCDDKKPCVYKILVK